MSFSDFTGECTMIAFDSTVSRYSEFIKDSSAVCCVATVSSADDEKEPELILQSVSPLSTALFPPSKNLYLRVKTTEEFESLKPILKMYPGPNPICIRITATGEVMRSDAKRSVTITDSLLKTLSERIGEDNIYVK